ECPGRPRPAAPRGRRARRRRAGGAPRAALPVHPRGVARRHVPGGDDAARRRLRQGGGRRHPELRAAGGSRPQRPPGDRRRRAAARRVRGRPADGRAATPARDAGSRRAGSGL
ncbi:MAG: hypothetical protein AVDCRST_MAG48-1061, partial [uncultured Friedmanniella sp.]